MPTPIRPCPTPWKNSYRTRAEAEFKFAVNWATLPHRPYRCRCGKWHMTTMTTTRFRHREEMTDDR